MIELWQEMLSKNTAVKVFAVLFFIFSSVVFAQEIPLNLKADDLQFDQGTGVITAKGSVHARLNDMSVSAESMTVDTASNIVTLEGSVRMVRGSLEASGSRAVYDPKSEIGSIFDFKSVVKDPQVKGDIYLSSQRVEDAPHYKTGREGQSTTCDISRPHYYLKAKEFIYFPGEKIAGKSVTFYINETPLLWLPFYIYDLKKRRVSLLMPVLGSNSVEGNFMKNQIDYYADDGASSSVFVDLMSIKGTGYGFDHGYKLNKKQSGDLYLYHLYENDTNLPDWVAKIKHELIFDKNNKAALGYEYSNIYLVPSGRLDQTGYKLGFEHKDEKSSGSFNFNAFENRYSSLADYSAQLRFSADKTDTSYAYSYRGGLSAPKWQNITQSLYHTRKLFTDDLDMGVNINYYRTVTAEGFPYDASLYPEATLSYRGPFYNLKATESGYIDTDGNNFTGDNNVEYVEKLPETVLTLDRIDLKYFSLDSGASYGRFHESKFISPKMPQRHFTANRYKGTLGLSRSFSLPAASTLSISGGVNQFSYDTGDQRYLIKDDIVLRTELGGFYSNTATYNRAINDGNSPFFFDSKGSDYHSLRDKMTFYDTGRQRFTIDGGYNYLINK
ncbi:MAG: LptA/OstA family protein [Candidatus Margulisiibacteriota bacterium]